MITGLTLTRDMILLQARRLPAAPQVLAGLSELLQDINTDLDQIADQIRVDPALAARVIRISNSPVFGAGARVGSIGEAVNRVGFGEVTRLVGIATVAGMVEHALANYKIPAEHMRESMLLHALASEALAGRAGLDGATAYAGGLLRGIGIMILDRIAREQPGEAWGAARFASYGEWERERFGLPHPDVAAIVLGEWNFPHETVEAVRGHLHVGATGRANKFAAVLHLAGAITAVHGLALPGEKELWALTPEKLAAADLDGEQFEAAADRAFAQFEQQRAALY